MYIPYKLKKGEHVMKKKFKISKSKYHEIMIAMAFFKNIAEVVIEILIKIH